MRVSGREKSSCRFSHLGDHQRKAVPRCLFFFELLFARFSQCVELCSPPGVIVSPLGLYPFPLFDAIKRGIQGSLFHMHHFVGHPANPLNDAVAMQWPEGQRLQNEHVERALEEIGLGIRHLCYRLSMLGIIALQYLRCQGIVFVVCRSTESSRPRVAVISLFLTSRMNRWIVSTRDLSIKFNNIVPRPEFGST